LTRSSRDFSGRPKWKLTTSGRNSSSTSQAASLVKDKQVTTAFGVFQLNEESGALFL